MAKTFGQLYTHKSRPPLIQWASVAAIPLFILLAVYFNNTRRHFYGECYGDYRGIAKGQEGGGGGGEEGGAKGAKGAKDAAGTEGAAGAEGAEGGKPAAGLWNVYFDQLVPAHIACVQELDQAIAGGGKEYAENARKVWGESIPYLPDFTSNYQGLRGTMWYYYGPTILDPRLAPGILAAASATGTPRPSGAPAGPGGPGAPPVAGPPSTARPMNRVTDIDLAPTPPPTPTPSATPEVSPRPPPPPSPPPTPYVPEARHLTAQLPGALTIEHMFLTDIIIRDVPWSVYGAPRVDGEYPFGHLAPNSLGALAPYEFVDAEHGSKSVGGQKISFGDLEGDRFPKNELAPVLILHGIAMIAALPYAEQTPRFQRDQMYIDGEGRDPRATPSGGRVQNLEAWKQMYLDEMNGPKGIKETYENSDTELKKLITEQDEARLKYGSTWDPLIKAEAPKAAPFGVKEAASRKASEAKINLLKKAAADVPKSYKNPEGHEPRAPLRKDYTPRHETQWSIEPDGKVLQALLPERVCHINLGANSGVRPGWRFEAYARVKNFDFVHKAWLEVQIANPEWSACIILERQRTYRRCPQCLYVARNPEERYCPYRSLAEKGGVREMTGIPETPVDKANPEYPLQPGDPIWNPFFRAVKPLHFWLLGSGGNFYTRAQIAEKMQYYGAVVDTQRVPGKTDFVFKTRVISKEEQETEKLANLYYMTFMHEWEVLRFLEND